MPVGLRSASLLPATFAALVALAGSARAADTIVAVFPIEDPSGRFEAAALQALGDYLTARVGDIPGWSIVPSAQLREQIRAQQAESFKTCYDEACQIEIGKELAASKAVSTKIAAIGADCLLSSYLFDLTRAATDATATVRATCDEQSMLRALDDVAARFRQVAIRAAEAGGVRFGALEVTSDPPGGEIFVDAARTGLFTPARLETVRAGRHRVAVETDEAKGEAEVEVRASETATVSIALAPRPCVLAISTHPSGAAVTLGGKPAGTSPLTVEVSPGLLEIGAETEDGLTGRASVFARPSRQAREISIVLAADPARVPAAEEDGGGIGIGWLIASGVLLGGGVALDVAPSWARDHRLDALDFVPVGLYVLSAGAAALGLIPAL